MASTSERKVIRMSLLLSVISFGCYSSKPAAFDFGYGTVELPKAYRFDPRGTERLPDHVRFLFTRVNDTYWNGQTSYAENLVLSVINPNLSDATTRALINRGGLDALSTKQPFSSEIDSGLEFQIAAAHYERHPVNEAATVVRLIDRPRRRVLAWYGYNKHYSVAKAKSYLKEINNSIQIDPAIYTRFPDYEKWKGNAWMDAYFENKTLLIEALKPYNLGLPFQQYIGDTSAWESHENLMVAIDGERPAQLHFVELHTGQPCSSLNEISPDLRLSFRESFQGKPLPACFKVHKLNFWIKHTGGPNPIEAWLRSVR